ncbi:MAG: ribosome biogenesis GTPase Der [Myxococcota bacterium]
MSRRPREGRAALPLPGGAGGSRPVVAVVGRPNVGKSTLFNRLAGKHVAIVEDVPGVTRDRHYAEAEAFGRPYVLVDTGGFDPKSGDPRTAGIVHQVGLALQECDLVVCVLDATAEPLAADREAVAMLRQTDKPVLYVANKADSRDRALQAASHYALGLDDILPVSALHGHGVGDLEEAIVRALPPQDEPEEPELDPSLLRVAIVGRPNAGKSSLTNRLLGEDRHLVDARPGTTVDSVDTLLERGDHRMVLIDTAGMRRKRGIEEGVEALAVYQAIRAIERSDVVVLLVDAETGVAEQDAKIVGLAVDRGRAVVVALNKVDLLDRQAQKDAIERARDVLSFLPWARVVRVSATRGTGLQKLLDAVEEAGREHRKRATTGEVNHFFEEVLQRHPPPSFRNRPVRLFYVTQAQTAPPTFVVVTNEPKGVHFSYQRYIVNQLRERFGFQGTPVKVRYRARKRS